MDIQSAIVEQMHCYYKATDIPLQLLDLRGNVLESFSDHFLYCSLTREACGERAFCQRLHEEGCAQSVHLREGYIFSCPAGLIHYTVPVFADGKHAYSILAGPVALEYPDIAVVDNLIQQCGCSLDYRKRLYGALGAVPIVEPVRLQYLNQLLFSLTDYMEKAFRVAESGPTDLGSVSDRRKHERARAGGMGTVMEKALDYIEEHFHGNLHLEEVARYVGLNASYFSQFFKREQGETFSQYLIRKKLEAACLLLKETHLTLAEISSELGFENQSYFSRLFKKRMGLSPNQYRRREGLLEAAEKEDMGME